MINVFKWVKKCYCCKYHRLYFIKNDTTKKCNFQLLLNKLNNYSINHEKGTNLTL